MPIYYLLSEGAPPIGVGGAFSFIGIFSFTFRSRQTEKDTPEPLKPLILLGFSGHKKKAGNGNRTHYLLFSYAFEKSRENPETQ